MRLGISKKFQKMLPKPLAQLLWNFLYIIKHPASLFNNEQFSYALRERVGNSPVKTKPLAPIRFKLYSNFRLATDSTTFGTFGHLCSEIDITKKNSKPIPNKPAFDMAVLSPKGAIDNVTRNALLEREIPVVVLINETTTKEDLHQIENLGEIYGVVNMSEIVLGTKIPREFKPNTSLLKLSQRINASLPESQGKQEVLLRLANLYHDPTRDIFEDLLASLGRKREEEPLISVVAPTRRQDNIANSIESFQKQSYPKKELVLVLHGVSLPKNFQEDLNIKIVHCKATEIFGDCLNKGVKAASGYLIVKIDDDDLYGRDHLFDLYYAWQTTGTDIVGKLGHYILLKEENIYLLWHSEHSEKLCTHLPGGTMLSTKSLLEFYKFASVKNSIDTELLFRMKRDNRKIYSTIPYNYVRVRHENGHTFQLDKQYFIEKSDGIIDDTEAHSLVYTDASALEQHLLADRVV